MRDPSVVQTRTDINSNCVYVWGTDRNTSAYWAYMAPSDVQIAGIVLGRAGSNAAARFQYHHGDGTKNWRLIIEGDTAYRWYASGFLPEGNATQNLGSTGSRWALGYISEVRLGDGTVRVLTGAGSPEGSVTAPVGSLYTRTDGGAGTTLYVKESGSGNTGWVGK